jgi:hypothetical protein
VNNFEQTCIYGLPNTSLTPRQSCFKEGNEMRADTDSVQLPGTPLSNEGSGEWQFLKRSSAVRNTEYAIPRQLSLPNGKSRITIND